MWLFQKRAGLYHGRVMDHEQLTFCSISVILHSRQSTGNLSYSGKTKWGPCRYPQRSQSVFKIHFDYSKTQCKKVPLDIPEDRILKPTGDRKPSQSCRELCQKKLACLRRAFNISVYLIALNFYSLCTLSLKAELWGERNLFFEEFDCWPVWRAPHWSLPPIGAPGYWRFSAW